MGVREFIIIDYYPTGGRPLGIGVSIITACRCVNVRYILCYSLLDSVGPAESAYNAFLGERVLLLLDERINSYRLPGALWPVAHILPVWVSAKDRVRVKPRPVLELIYILSICRSAGPVHEPVRLVGGIVKVVYTYITGHHPSYCLVLVP